MSMSVQRAITCRPPETGRSYTTRWDRTAPRDEAVYSVMR